MEIKRYFAWGSKTRQYFDTYEEAYAYAQEMHEAYGWLITIEPVYSL
jgi:hypothetical protein